MTAPKSGGPVTRSISPSSRRHSSFASASTSTFSAARTFQRSASPTPVHHSRYPSLSFSMARPGSPTRSISFSSRAEKPPSAAAPQKRTCMCSPTNHPGSFRCSLHKGASNNHQTASCGSSSRLNMRRSAMKNSLVRIGTVEGDWVRRALAALIRPSSHHQRRRGEFRPRPSRFSAMSKS